MQGPYKGLQRSASDWLFTLPSFCLDLFLKIFTLSMLSVTSLLRWLQSLSWQPSIKYIHFTSPTNMHYAFIVSQAMFCHTAYKSKQNRGNIFLPSYSFVSIGDLGERRKDNKCIRKHSMSGDNIYARKRQSLVQEVANASSTPSLILLTLAKTLITLQVISPLFILVFPLYTTLISSKKGLLFSFFAPNSQNLKYA